MTEIKVNFDVEEKNATTQSRGDAKKIENVIAGLIIDAAIEVHRTLGGPGLLESLYEEALYQELKLRNISVQAQVQIPVIYKGYTLRNPMHLDLLVDGKVIVEVKAAEQEQSVHRAQVLTYLRLTGLKLGLLLNFGQKLIHNGTERIVNNL
jgi:GxxExxY protein